MGFQVRTILVLARLFVPQVEVLGSFWLLEGSRRWESGGNGEIPEQSLKSHKSLALTNRCVGATGCSLDYLTKRVNERIS